MNAVGLRRVTRLLTGTAPAALLLLVACEEELAPQITKFEVDPNCDVITLHTAGRDSMGTIVIDTLGTWMEVRYFARATGGNRLDDPTGTSGTLEYQWNFGDGSGANNRDSGTHKYTEPSPPEGYTVSLTVKDKDGQTATASQRVIVGEIGTTVDVLSVDIESGHSTPDIVNANVGRLYTIDISNPEQPAVRQTDTLPAAGRDIDVENGHAYVAMGTKGLRIFDLATPQTPVSRATLVVRNPSGSEGDDAVQGVDVVENMAYLALRNQLLIRADVSNASAPTLVSGDSVLWQSAANLAVPSDVVVVGNTAAIANGYGMLVADFSVSESPYLLGLGSHTPGNAQDVTNRADTNTFLIADGNVGVELFDLTNPLLPLQTGWFGTAGTVTSIATSGNLAFIADSAGGIQVVDISGGGNPVPVGHVNTPGNAIEIDAAGDYLYVANTGGLQIVDVSDPADPVLVGSIDGLGQGESIAVSGSYAYVLVNGNLNGWYGSLSGHLETPCPASGLVAQYTWSWNFGDGTAPALHSSTPRHRFPPQARSYDVILTVKEEQSSVARSDTLRIDIPEY